MKARPVLEKLVAVLRLLLNNDVRGSDSAFNINQHPVYYVSFFCLIIDRLNSIAVHA